MVHLSTTYIIFLVAVKVTRNESKSRSDFYMHIYVKADILTEFKFESDKTSS